MQNETNPFLNFLTESLVLNKKNLRDSSQTRSLLTLLVELQESARLNNDKESALLINQALQDAGVKLKERRSFSLEIN